jgi:predicted GH43/DUF377 family glycosyl hydrolase
MLCRIILFSAFLPFYLAAEDFLEKLARENTIVLSTKKILLENYPDAFNPSIIQFGDGFLLTFRYVPDPFDFPWLSYIGIVLLNNDFDLISEPELLNTRNSYSKTDSQSEDARIFTHRGRIFVTYNDNIDNYHADSNEKREIFIAELLYDIDHFYLSKPLKLLHEAYSFRLQEKNWMPFEWDKKLLFIYTIDPHAVLFTNFYNGACYTYHETSSMIDWAFGPLRGGTPPLLVDGEYLSFFHSPKMVSSNSSWDLPLWHYFMGAYTFSAEPPFHLKKISPMPIVSDDFYTQSNAEKRVIFPGGCVILDSKIYVAYGKDDCEIWIATLDKKALMDSLVSVQ